MIIALYARVSTTEQAIHGLSIDTQLDNLREWAKQHGHTIAKEYVDAGVSGKTPPNKRPALSRFFSDIESGLRVDALCFTKLDRFFRSVKYYYLAMQTLDKCHVAWQTTQEEYETVSAAGKLKTNLLLAVAEHEADRTSERVRVALQTKRARKEAVTGCVPFGYKLDGKKIVIDEAKKAAIMAFYQRYLATNSIKDARAAIAEQGFPISYYKADELLSSRAYVGEYFGVDGMTPPYLTEDEYKHIQTMRKRILRQPKGDRCYLFSGLVVCGVCGYAYCGITQNNGYKDYTYYRCQYENYAKRGCTNRRHYSQKRIEEYLLANVMGDFDNYKASLAPPQDDVKKKIEQLKQRKARVMDLYLDGLISLDDCKRRTSECEARIAGLEAQETVDISAVEELLKTPWRDMYDAVDDKVKAQFWRTIIKKIRLYPDWRIEVEFN